jgi:hypothetical protein
MENSELKPGHYWGGRLMMHGQWLEAHNGYEEHETETPPLFASSPTASSTSMASARSSTASELDDLLNALDSESQRGSVRASHVPGAAMGRDSVFNDPLDEMFQTLEQQNLLKYA